MINRMTRQRYNTLRRPPFIKAPTLVVWGRDDETNALEMGETRAAGHKDPPYEGAQRWRP